MNIFANRLTMRNIAFICLLLPSFQLQAALDNNAKAEVDHLLSFVEQSGCIFIRNGSRHNPASARKHLQRKLDHINKRISSAEQFIEYGASQSSFSGKVYTVDCQGKIIPSKQWLNKELDSYRKGL